MLAPASQGWQQRRTLFAANSSAHLHLVTLDNIILSEHLQSKHFAAHMLPNEKHFPEAPLSNDLDNFERIEAGGRDRRCDVKV